MRVLVTGARGFVGSHALHSLVQAGLEVHALSRHPPRGADGAVSWHQGDLLSTGGPETVVSAVRPTHLLHLAWVTEHGTYWSSPDNALWLEASRALARAFHANGGRRFVGVGTCAEYDWSGGVCDEQNTPLRPRTVYGRAKAAFGEELLTFPGSAWARPFFVYGPGEQPQRLVPSITATLSRGETAHCRTGKLRRDFIYVADCASALVRLLQSEEPGAFNVATGTAVAIEEIVLAIATALHAEDRVIINEPSEGADEDALVVGTTGRIRSLGWSPVWDLRAGIEESIARTYASENQPHEIH
ncbi:MAG: NAD(P)-dependent oxidoreductase [Acidobacteriota bacterium]